MDFDLSKIIFELSNLFGPSGYEGPVSKRVSKLMNPYVDEVSTDCLGNVIGVRRCGIPGAKKLLFDAHIDEVGLIVTGTEEGFLRFDILGSIDKRVLPALEVCVLCEEPVFGIITCMPPHVLPPDASDKPFEELLIDVGLSEDEVRFRIEPGTPVVFTTRCLALLNDMISGKAMDNRSCVASMLYAAHMLKDEPLNVDLYFLASTQEEVGLRGAKTAVFSIAPDYAVSVDVTFGKTPDSKPDRSYKVGGGPAIGVGPNMNRNITRRLITLAEENSIPHQIEVMSGNSGTNGWAIQTSREGVSTAVLSLPIRYMHTPVETLNTKDAEKVAELLALLAKSMGREGL